MSDEYPYDDSVMPGALTPRGRSVSGDFHVQGEREFIGADMAGGESWCAWVCGCGASGDSVDSMVQHAQAHDRKDRTR